MATSSPGNLRAAARNLFVALPMAMVFLLATLQPLAAEPAARDTELALHPELEPIRPFLGRTWRGDLTDPGSALQRIDVVRYDRTLNGEVVRMLHSINNGDLGGEMIIRYSEEAQRVEFHYFTSAGFYSTGTIRFRGRSLIAEDLSVPGQPGMRVIRRLDGDRMLSRTQMSVGGKWSRGTDQIYLPAPDEKIRYR